MKNIKLFALFAIMIGSATLKCGLLDSFSDISDTISKISSTATTATVAPSTSTQVIPDAADLSQFSQYNGIANVADVTDFVKANAGKEIWVDSCTFNGKLCCANPPTCNIDSNKVKLTYVPRPFPVSIQDKFWSAPDGSKISPALHIYNNSGDWATGGINFFGYKVLPDASNVALALYGNNDALEKLYAKTPVKQLVANKLAEQKALEDARQKAELEEKAKKEEAERQQKALEDARQKAELEEKAKKEEEAQKQKASEEDKQRSSMGETDVHTGGPYIIAKPEYVRSDLPTAAKSPTTAAKSPTAKAAKKCLIAGNDVNSIPQLSDLTTQKSCSPSNIRARYNKKGLCTLDIAKPKTAVNLGAMKQAQCNVRTLVKWQ